MQAVKSSLAAAIKACLRNWHQIVLGQVADEWAVDMPKVPMLKYMPVPAIPAEGHAHAMTVAV